MAISNLLDKIKEDAKAEADAIIQKAHSEVAEIQKSRENEANKQRQLILEKAQKEAKSKADRIISSAELKVRNDKLRAKQDAIDNVFNLALNQLEQLSDTDFLEYIKNAILSASFTGEAELLLSKEDQDKINPGFVSSINSELAKLGRNATVKLATDKEITKRGFVLNRNGIEINFTFESMLTSLKEEMENEITEVLFK